MKNLALLAMAAVIGVFSFNQAEAASTKKSTSYAPTATLSEIPQTATAPAIGKYAFVGTAGNLEFRQGTGVLEVKVPISYDQVKANGGSLGAIKMFVSHATFENGGWVLKGRQKYEDHMVDGGVSGSHVKAVIKLSDDMKKSDFVWFRLWGHNKTASNKAGEWLWIEKTQFTRPDKKAQPGYEFIYDTRKGSVTFVPEGYDTRL